MYRKKLSLLHWRWVGGEIWRQIFNSLFQFDRLVLPLLARTPGIRSVPQSPNVSWGHAFVSMPHPCRWFPCNTFHHIPIYTILQSDEAALDSKPALPVCPSVPETLNLWGQSRSQVRSSGTGLHSVSAWKEDFVLVGSSLLVKFVSSLSPLLPREDCQTLQCHADIYGMSQTWSGCIKLDQEMAAPPPAAQTVSGGPSYWLALFYRPHQGPIGRQPRVATPPCISASAKSRVQRVGVFCTSKLPLFLVCTSIKIYVSQCLIFAHWSPGHKAEVMNIKQQKASGSYPSRRPLLGFFLFTTAFK